MDRYKELWQEREPERRQQQFKKFNPNPIPERNWWDIEQPPEPREPFPEYEDWKTQTEAGTLPEKFKAEIPGRELLEQWGGLPEELEGAPTYEPTEVPGEILTGIPERFQPLMDYLGLTDPKDLADVIGEATDKDLALIMEIAGVKEKEEKEKFISQYSDDELAKMHETGDISTEDYENELKARKSIAVITGEITEESGGIIDLLKDYTQLTGEKISIEQYPAEQLLEMGMLKKDIMRVALKEYENGRTSEQIISKLALDYGLTTEQANLYVIKMSEFIE